MDTLYDLVAICSLGFVFMINSTYILWFSFHYF